jgi:hypothetical protein
VKSWSGKKGLALEIGKQGFIFVYLSYCESFLSGFLLEGLEITPYLAVSFA